MKHFSIVLLVFGAVLAGCESKQSGEIAVTPASTSNEALVRALNAIERKDRDAMLPLVSGGSKAQDFFGSLIDSFRAIDDFRQKFIDTYGEKAWDDFQAPLPEGQRRPDMNLTMPDLAQIQKDASTWEVNDQNQGVFDQLVQISLPFKQAKGGWVIDGAGVFPDEMTLVGYTETQRKMTAFIKSYMKAIGHPGISAEDIDYQMGKDLMIFLMGGELKVGGGSPNPDRFKLDEM